MTIEWCGDKCTPKQFAQKEILSVLANRLFEAADTDINNMTEKELAEVKRQADILFRRLEKQYGYIEGSWITNFR